MNRRILNIGGIICGLVIVLTSCQSSKDKPLPILGFPQVVGNDTVKHQIPDFKFVNQDSQYITNESLADKIYIADFFFINCPSICPRVTAQKLRILDRFKNDDDLMLVSHSIDVKYDTIPALKAYEQRLDIPEGRWYFLTGDKNEIFDIAEQYFSIAYEDPSAPGGFDHSGKIILVDKDRHIRSFCEGTDPKDVDRFMDDIAKLLKEHREITD